MTDLKPGTLVQGTTTAHPYKLLILRTSLHGALFKGIGGTGAQQGPRTLALARHPQALQEGELA